MDFTFDEDQEEIRALARRVIGDHSTPERLTEVESEDDGFDRRLYADLAAAGLLGLAFPDDVGGAGLGFAEACLVLEEVGRFAAAAPFFESVVLGGLAIDAFGSTECRAALLPGMIEGRTVLTAALAEEHASPRAPATLATPDGPDHWRIDGLKTCVPAGLVADTVLVPASLPDGGGTAVFVVDPASAGVTRQRQDTSRGRPEARLELDGAKVAATDRLGGDAAGGEVLDWLIDRATSGLCVLAIGACEEALRLTAEYVQERHQFGHPLAKFQAVGQRAADAYVDTAAIRLTAWQAVWRLSVGLPAADEVAIAKFWACEGGQRVVHAAQHLHGGVGVDRSYPLHRYFLLAKHVELSLGAASSQLAAIGRRLAEQPA